MAKVRLFGGKPLLVGGKIAISDGCCCTAAQACPDPLPSQECPRTLCFEFKIDQSEIDNQNGSDFFDWLTVGGSVIFGVFFDWSANTMWACAYDCVCSNAVGCSVNPIGFAGIWHSMQISTWKDGSQIMYSLTLDGVNLGNQIFLNSLPAYDSTLLRFGSEFYGNPGAHRSIRNIHYVGNPTLAEANFDFPGDTFDSIVGSNITVTDEIRVDTSGTDADYAEVEIESNFDCLCGPVSVSVLCSCGSATLTKCGWSLLPYAPGMAQPYYKSAATYYHSNQTINTSNCCNTGSSVYDETGNWLSTLVGTTCVQSNFTNACNWSQTVCGNASSGAGCGYTDPISFDQHDCHSGTFEGCVPQCCMGFTSDPFTATHGGYTYHLPICGQDNTICGNPNGNFCGGVPVGQKCCTDHLTDSGSSGVDLSDEYTTLELLQDTLGVISYSNYANCAGGFPRANVQLICETTADLSSCRYKFSISPQTADTKITWRMTEVDPYGGTSNTNFCTVIPPGSTNSSEFDMGFPNVALWLDGTCGPNCGGGASGCWEMSRYLSTIVGGLGCPNASCNT